MEQVFYILDGQHKFKAAMTSRLQLEKGRDPVPLWCRVFRCQVLKPGLSVDVRQRLAGRQQARASNIKTQSISESMTILLNAAKAEVEEAKRGNRAVRHNLTSYLADAYTKSGRSTVKDGDVVCLTPNLS